MRKNGAASDSQPLEAKIEALETRLASLDANSKAGRAVQAELDALYAAYVHN